MARSGTLRWVVSAPMSAGFHEAAGPDVSDDRGARLRVLFLSWRDRGHPEAGGAEAFLDQVSRELAGRGHDVEVFTAHYPGALLDETLQNRRVRRRGGRFSVYPRAALELLRRRGSFDVVVDVQNGLPFWAPLFTNRPVVNLVHHVHREQWPEVFGPLRARLGWWLESWLAPRVYARSRYIVVSHATKLELTGLGVDRDRIDVVYNGRDPQVESDPVARDENPSLVVLGRLVPHKRVELAISAAAALREQHPGLVLSVVGHGYFLPQLEDYAASIGATAHVRFLGFVDEDVKNRVLAASWLNLLPSVKEGWGLAIIEAAAHGVPSVAFRDASGTTESIIDGTTGLLVGDEAEFVAAVGELLADRVRRQGMGEKAKTFSEQFTWQATTDKVERLLRGTSGVQSMSSTPLPLVPGPATEGELDQLPS
jgi:glycosyltransferase involved in cell wall biosynthesis